MSNESSINQPWSLSDLINQVKRDLLIRPIGADDPAPLFAIDEITVEINFVVDGAVKGGLSLLKVVEIGSEVGEQRVQKAVVKLSPLLSKEQMLEDLSAKHPEIFQQISSNGLKVYLRGTSTIQDTPKR